MEQWSNNSTNPFWNSTYGYAKGRSSSIDLHLQVQEKPSRLAQIYIYIYIYIICVCVCRYMFIPTIVCYLKLNTRWWRKNATSTLASSDPGQYLAPPPKAVNFLHIWSWLWDFIERIISTVLCVCFGFYYQKITLFQIETLIFKPS